MLHVLDPFRDITFYSLLIRMLLAMFCGCVIGAERESKRRPAGLRTHILICLGASMTTLTSQYLCYKMGYYTDIGRMGAQVIAGIGFIGAGTIITTRRRHIKGLTTAAGLWAAAVVGLSIGAGFFEIGVIATVAILIVEALLVKLEYFLLKHTPEIILYFEYDETASLETVLQICRQHELEVQYMEFMREISEDRKACLILKLRLNKECPVTDLLTKFREINGMAVVESL